MRLDGLKARLAALEAVKDLPATGELARDARRQPRRPQRCDFDLAHAHCTEGEYEQALEHLLEIIIRTDRKLEREGARKAMINVFNLLGGEEQMADLFDLSPPAGHGAQLNRRQTGNRAAGHVRHRPHRAGNPRRTPAT